MKTYTLDNTQEIYSTTSFPDIFLVSDHFGGFDINFKNSILDHIAKFAKHGTTVVTYYIFNDQVKKNYPTLNFLLSAVQTSTVFQSLQNYNIHPDLNYKNFVCSFNGSPHVSRKLLVSIIKKFNWFDANYCSKNFSYSTDILDGHLTDYVSNSNNFYRKFFISPDSEDFFRTINSFGHVRFDHANNIYNLETKLTESFLHVVSETLATSSHPFMSEKPFYSIVTRGLFLAYAQPEYHTHFEKHFGFKKYTKLFDYRFDTIQNPVERLVELMTMISKFSRLSTDDWRDLYLLQQDEIGYNYDHYFSGDYLKCLGQYEQ